MQNYLQKNARKKLSAAIAAATLIFAAAVLAVYAVLSKTHGYMQIYTDASAPAASFYETPYKQAENIDARADDKMKKMNNSAKNNAKNDISVSKNENMPAKCESVLVLTDTDGVKEIPLEEYVRGCVFGEMPLTFEPQALMAQCVAARTFAVRQALGMSKHVNADVCTSPACCQNYILPESRTVGEEELKKLNDAVNATRGIIAVYEGEPIEAVYHASSGSGTLNSEDVWGGKVEYLRAVKAPDGEDAIAVSGMGHRVGMSQHGANLLAKEGLGYTEILKYYYSGISFGFAK